MTDDDRLLLELAIDPQGPTMEVWGSFARLEAFYGPGPQIDWLWGFWRERGPQLGFFVPPPDQRGLPRDRWPDLPGARRRWLTS